MAARRGGRDDLSGDRRAGEPRRARPEVPEPRRTRAEGADRPRTVIAGRVRPRPEPEPEPPAEERREEPERHEEPERSRPEGLTAGRAGLLGLRHVRELTGREAEGITSVRPVEDGWLVDVEVVEDRRIPSSGDVLALYQAELDLDGDLVSYRRTRRYRRGRSDFDETS